MRARLVVVLVCLTSAASAQPGATVPEAVRAERSARLDSALTALHADGLFDGALAISNGGGEAVYQFAAGTYEGEPVKPTTPLYLASVSKAMTAAAALSLVADGLVDLDAPVGRYLDPWPYREVSVHHLLNQTSGLHWFGTVTAERDTTRPVTTADLLALVATHRPPLQAAPGSAFAYSNANYAALAAVVEAALGRPFAEAMRARVFAPAGMADAFVGPSGEEDWIAWVGGDGDAVHASALDALAFDAAFWTGRIVPDSLVEAARVPPALADGTASRYVAGRFLTDDPRPLIGHFGEGRRAKTALWRERETDTTYALLMAGDGIHRTPILVAAMAIWNGEPFTLPEARPVADVPEAVLARHVGSYRSGMGLLHITLEGGQLHLEPEGAGGSEPLIPASETVFYFGGQDLTWEFVVEDGRTTGLMLQDHPETLGERVE